MFNCENHYVQQLLEIANRTVNNIDGDEYIDYQVKDFQKEAEEAGFIKLGSGFFSQAWTHPELSKYAIKLGFKKEDSGAAYAAYCRQNQGKAGIPVIHDITRTNACYVVLMDKLIPYQKVWKIYSAKREYYSVTGRGNVTKPRCLKEYSVAINIIRYMPNETWLSSEDLELPIYQTCKEIESYFVGIASFDLHDENIMVDRFGNLVITDPVSFTKTDQDSPKKAHEVDFRGRVSPNFVHAFDAGHMDWDKWLWISAEKKPKIGTATKLGACGAKKPHFLIARDVRNGIKRNR